MIVLLAAARTRRCARRLLALLARLMTAPSPAGLQHVACCMQNRPPPCPNNAARRHAVGAGAPPNLGRVCGVAAAAGRLQAKGARGARIACVPLPGVRLGCMRACSRARACVPGRLRGCARAMCVRRGCLRAASLGAARRHQPGDRAPPRGRRRWLRCTDSQLCCWCCDCTGWGARRARAQLSQMQGGEDKGDHPPITPVRAATEAELGGGEAWLVYDYVSRHFLASLSSERWRGLRVQRCACRCCRDCRPAAAAAVTAAAAAAVTAAAAAAINDRQATACSKRPRRCSVAAARPSPLPAAWCCGPASQPSCPGRWAARTACGHWNSQHNAGLAASHWLHVPASSLHWLMHLLLPPLLLLNLLPAGQPGGAAAAAERGAGAAAEGRRAARWQD